MELSMKKTDLKVVPFVQPAEYYFEKGKKSLDAGDLKNAREYLARANQLERKNTDILFHLAMVLTELSQYEQSNEMLHQILSMTEPGWVECYFYLGKNYLLLAEFEQSVDNLIQFIENCDEDNELLVEAEELVSIIQQELVESEDIYLEDEDDDELILHLDMGLQLLHQNEIDKAILIFKEIIELYGDVLPAHNNLALCYLYLGQEEEALIYLEKILRIEPTNLNAICIFFSILKRIGNVFKTYKTLEMLWQVKPLNADQAVTLAATLALAGEYRTSYKWFKYFDHQSRFEDYKFYFWFAKAAYFTDHHAEAEKLFEKMLSKFPNKTIAPPWEQALPFEHEELVPIKSSDYELSIRLATLYFTLKGTEADKQEIIQFYRTNSFPISKYEQKLLDQLENMPCEPLFVSEVAYRIEVVYENNFEKGTQVIMEWFEIFVQYDEQICELPDVTVWAAVADYLFHKQNNLPMSRKQVANLHEVAPELLNEQLEKYFDFTKRI